MTINNLHIIKLLWTQNHLHMMHTCKQTNNSNLRILKICEFFSETYQNKAKESVNTYQPIVLLKISALSLRIEMKYEKLESDFFYKKIMFWCFQDSVSRPEEAQRKYDVTTKHVRFKLLFLWFSFITCEGYWQVSLIKNISEILYYFYFV